MTPTVSTGGGEECADVLADMMEATPGGRAAPLGRPARGLSTAVGRVTSESPTYAILQNDPMDQKIRIQFQALNLYHFLLAWVRKVRFPGAEERRGCAERTAPLAG